MEKLLKQRVEILAQEIDKMKSGGAGEGYTKAEADDKFLSKADASTALAGKQDSLDPTQLAAVNSGIDSTKVAQIETNKTNILSVKNDVIALEGNKIGVNNFNIGAYVTNPDVTVVGDSLTVNKTVTLPITVPKTGKYYLLANVSNISVGSGGSAYLFVRQSTTNLLGFTFSTTGDISGEFTVTDASALNFLFSFTSESVTIKDIMIVSEEAYNAGFTSYQPFALPNYDLTRLEAEDRAALAEVVDSGAKNLLDTIEGTFTSGNATLVCGTDKTVALTVSGEISTNTSFSLFKSGVFVPNTYAGCIVSGAPSNSDASFAIVVAYSDNGTTQADSVMVRSNEYHQISSSYAYVGIFVYILAGAPTVNNLIFKPMICTEAYWNVSQAYQPYRPSYQELYEMVLSLQTTRTATTRKTTKTKTNEE